MPTDRDGGAAMGRVDEWPSVPSALILALTERETDCFDGFAGARGHGMGFLSVSPTSDWVVAKI